MSDQPDPMAQQQEAATPEEQLRAALKSGANWFYWIAGLSVVNTVLELTGADIRFIIGLGLTQIVDVVARESGAAGTMVPLLIDAAIVGLFLLFGYKANQGAGWGFVVGMLVYLLDGGILLLLEDYKSAAFHAFALFFLFKGFRALRELKKLEAQKYAVPGLSQVRTD